MHLGRLEAPFEPGLRTAIEAFDWGSPEVNGYLQRYAETIVAHGLGTVLVLTEGAEILGFVSLSFSSIVLTNSEKGTFRAVRTAFGSLRIGSIGTATAHQERSANNDHVDWYGRRGWVPNDARRERDRLEGRNLTSMRFDLQRPAAG